MTIPSYHKSLNDLHIGCEKPRSYFIPFESAKAAGDGKRENSKYFINLCGEWNFRFFKSFEDFSDDFINMDTAASGFDRIKVPMNWQMETERNYDKPLYSNLKYPFPTDPPHVPDENPCGLYRRDFDLSDELSGRGLFLNFEGVDSAFYVWINGLFAGYSQVSHCTSEFNITKYVKTGKNSMAVLVVKWCDGSYLEDQDFYRLSGIFREVYILARAEKHIRDVFIKTYIDPAFNKAELKIETELTGAAPVGCCLISPAGQILYDSIEHVPCFPIAINNPDLWNDEDPKLYKVYFTVGDEVILVKVGLRNITISNSTFLLNGKKIKARGINHHDTDPVLGHTALYKDMLEDLYILKRCNCNTIRTSHYPNDPRFLELCDELGFMVINEADLETHGMGYNTDTDWDWFRWSRLSSIPEWREAYIDRAARLFERDKNHACVILWSLGNESGIGENHRAMAGYIRERDQRAFIHYENAHKEFKAVPDGECFVDISDVESRMYPDIHYIKEYLEDNSNEKPLFLCEYVNSMTTGDVYANWDLVLEYDQFFGGCIWEMTDHAVSIKDENGHDRYYYGGDFGDFPNDGICCLDGLVYPDRRPRPGLLDMKRVYQPFHTEFNKGSVTVKSYRYFTTLWDLDLYWKIERNGNLVLEGTIPSLNIAPGEEKCYKLFKPEELQLYGDCYLTLSFIQNQDALWAAAGYETGFEQFQIPAPALTKHAVSKEKLSCEDESRYIRIQTKNTKAVFDKAYGHLVSLIDNGRELLWEPVKFKFWRAPAYNETGIAKCWDDAGLNHIKQKTYFCEINRISEDCVEIASDVSFGGPSAPPVIRAAVTYRFYAGGDIVISINGKVLENVPPLPRIGIEIVMPEGNEHMEFFGYGPGETYVDRHKAAKIARYRMLVKENFEHYIRPQENSSHYGTRWGMAGDSEGRGMLFTGYSLYDFCFNASHFTAELLTETKHDFELVPLGQTVINLDWKIHSMSGDVHIAAIENNRILNDKQFCFSFRIKPVDMKSIDPFDDYTKLHC